MISKCHVAAILVMTLVGLASEVATVHAQPLPEEARLLDTDVPTTWPTPPVISPDGQWIAYTKDEAVHIRNVADPDSHVHAPVAQLPGAALPPSDESTPIPRIGWEQLLQQMQPGEFLAMVTNDIAGLRWTPDGDGVMFAVGEYIPRDMSRRLVVSQASLDGNVKVLADSGNVRVSGSPQSGFQLTRDRKFLVFPGRGQSVSWELTNHKIHNRKFRYLTPSATSARWLGIENKSRQLVLLDEHLDIERIFDPTLPDPCDQFELQWSPDEHHVIWRQQLSGSDGWVGFHMNLETGRKRLLSGRLMTERFAFTGHGGEFLRCGQSESDAKWSKTSVGAHLTITSEDFETSRDLWRIRFDRDRATNDSTKITSLPSEPPLYFDPRFDLFAIGLPNHGPSVWTWHLMDRKGEKWQFPEDEDAQSPLKIAGFANDGNSVVAYNASKLFAISVAAIKNAANRENRLSSIARVLDSEVVHNDLIAPVISPDGRRVAYLNRDRLLVCDVDSNSPNPGNRQLATVPYSPRARELLSLLSSPKNLVTPDRPTNPDPAKTTPAKTKCQLFSLDWTAEGHSVVLGKSCLDAASNIPHSTFSELSVEGTVTRLGEFNAAGTRQGGTRGFYLTGDRRFLVLLRQRRPFIWNLGAAKPQACCFDDLVPSTTSDRWLAVEKDTHQFLVVDRDFREVKRFDQYLPGGGELQWSPNEQFVLWRQQTGIDYYDNYKGFRLNLDTGEKLAFSRQFMGGRIAFTGRGGELARWGAIGKTDKLTTRAVVTHAQVSLIPETGHPAPPIWSCATSYAQISAGRPDPQFKRFAIMITSAIAAEQPKWHLVDEMGRLWRLPGQEAGNPTDDYLNVIGFAGAGETLIVNDARHLFALPVATILSNSNQ